jgi:hypothetical protein
LSVRPQLPSPAHPLTEGQLACASQLARMILPVTEDAITAKQIIEWALETRSLGKVEKAISKAWPIYKGKRGVCTMEWRQLAQRWATVNKRIWEETKSTEDQKEEKIA